MNKPIWPSGDEESYRNLHELHPEDELFIAHPIRTLGLWIGELLGVAGAMALLCLLWYLVEHPELLK